MCPQRPLPTLPPIRHPLESDAMTSKAALNLGLSAVLALSLGACISVKTPDKPIEVNLNVTIRQEVLVRLQKDVDELIKQNPDAFPGTPALPGKRP